MKRVEELDAIREDLKDCCIPETEAERVYKAPRQATVYKWLSYATIGFALTGGFIVQSAFGSPTNKVVNYIGARIHPAFIGGLDSLAVSSTMFFLTAVLDGKIRREGELQERLIFTAENERARNSGERQPYSESEYNPETLVRDLR